LFTNLVVISLLTTTYDSYPAILAVTESASCCWWW